MQPTPVAPLASNVVLDQNFVENRVAAMRAMGATNADPPLVRSPFLKNVKTGVILPWSPGLAEQRDIMVNCDAFGNTDPSYWMTTVNPEAYSDEEQATLMQSAMSAIQGYRQHELPISQPEMNQPVVFPNDAKSMDEYFAETNAAMVNRLDALLE